MLAELDFSKTPASKAVAPITFTSRAYIDRFGVDDAAIEVHAAGVVSAAEQAREGMSATQALDLSIHLGGGKALKQTREAVFNWHRKVGGLNAGYAALLEYDTEVLANLRAAEAAGVLLHAPL